MSITCTRWRKNKMVTVKDGSTIRYALNNIHQYGMVNFKGYWYVVRTFLIPKTRYGT